MRHRKYTDKMNKYKVMKMKKGVQIYEIAKRIFPICRSITGNGVRETMAILKEYVPELEIFEVPSGTQVFDWTVPKEWNIKDAYIEDENGERIIDFKKNNLHVLGYSLPMDVYLSLEERCGTRFEEIRSRWY